MTYAVTHLLFLYYLSCASRELGYFRLKDIIFIIYKYILYLYRCFVFVFLPKYRFKNVLTNRRLTKLH